MIEKEVKKDPIRQERLSEAYRHLFAHHGVTTQTAFAEAIKVQRTAMSAAMNGNAAYLTKNLFIKICAAFPNVFNIDYFLTGEGTLLTTEEDVKSGRIERNRVTEPTNGYRPQWAETLIDLLTQQVKMNEGLAHDLHNALTEIHALRDELRQHCRSVPNYPESVSNVSPVSEP